MLKNFILFLVLSCFVVSTNAAENARLAGWHIGAHVGTQFFSSKISGAYSRTTPKTVGNLTYHAVTYTLNREQSTSISKNTFLGGINTKYIWNFGNDFFWGVGLATDFNGATIKKTLDHSAQVTVHDTLNNITTVETETASITHKIKNGYNIQIPFFLGYYLNDYWACFALIGPRLSQYKLSVDIVDSIEGTSSKTNNKVLWGADVGLGLAYKISPNMVLTTEVSHAFGQKYKGGTFTTETYLAYKTHLKPSNTTIKIGMSYQF